MTERLAIAAAIGIGIAIAIAQMVGKTPLAFDAGAYWAARPGDLYQADWGAASGHAAFLYSPAFADVLEPFRVLPERVFTGLWQLGLVLLLVATIRGWALVALLLTVPALLVGHPTILDWPALVGTEVAHGNIHILLGAVAVFGLRWPALWSIAIFSKVTPGVGVLWFAFRGEWRSFGIALGATAAIVAVSFLWLPSDWLDWGRFLIANQGHQFPFWVIPAGLPYRVALAVALLWWGARSNRPWVVPIAVGLSIPVPYPSMVATMVAAAYYLHRSPVLTLNLALNRVGNMGHMGTISRSETPSK